MLLHKGHPLFGFVIILSGNKTERMETVQRKIKSFNTTTKVCEQFALDAEGLVLYENDVAVVTKEVKPHYRAIHKITGKEVK